MPRRRFQVRGVVQGVGFRPGGNPVPYLANPDGVDASARRAMLDDLAKLNAMHAHEVGGLSDGRYSSCF